jgi:hypothetical protein
MPLPLAEARVYGKRAAGDSGAVMIQRDVPGTTLSSPLAGKVVIADDDRNRLLIESDDGRSVDLDGVIPRVEIGEPLALGAPIGHLDPRGVLVFRARERTKDGRNLTVDALDSLPQLGGADESLRAVSNWWREIHAWLRGEGPALRSHAHRAEMASGVTTPETKQ